MLQLHSGGWLSLGHDVWLGFYIAVGECHHVKLIVRL